TIPQPTARAAWGENMEQKELLKREGEFGTRRVMHYIFCLFFSLLLLRPQFEANIFLQSYMGRTENFPLEKLLSPEEHFTADRTLEADEIVKRLYLTEKEMHVFFVIESQHIESELRKVEHIEG
ncbi:hypothetical protein ACJX0J_036450, partial [Zea mays]